MVLFFLKTNNTNKMSSAHRAIIRDGMKRLKKLRKECGKKDEDEDGKQGSGDEFRDLAGEMIAQIKLVREEVTERNEMSKKHNNDHDTIEKSHGINKELMELDVNIKRMQTILDANEVEMNKAITKKRKPQKIAALEAQGVMLTSHPIIGVVQVV